MKKTTLILLLILFVFQIVKSQTACTNAINIFNSTPVNIPLVGTGGGGGAFLDSLSPALRSRQVWYKVPISRNTTISSTLLQLTSTGTFPANDSFGLVFYGPFNQIVTNCSDLSQPKMLDFEKGKLSIATPILLSNTLLEGSYYYMVLTFDTAIALQTVKASMYLSDPDLTFECNNKVSVIYENNLCNLTIDTATNRCVLTWQEFAGNNLMGYRIWRQANLTGSYNLLTTIPVSSSSTYIDVTSSPASQSYTYAVTAEDDCGNFYPILPTTKSLTSIHLISIADTNRAQLIWNNIFQPGIYNNVYDIYRSTDNSPFTSIGTIGVALPTITYTDISPPSGINRYAVGLGLSGTCNPMRLSSLGAAVQSSFSNITIINNTSTGVEDLTNSNRISIFPNPVKDIFSIDLTFLDKKTVNVSIIDVHGKKCFESNNFAENILIVERNNLKPGVYIVEIKGDKIYRNKLVFQ